MIYRFENFGIDTDRRELREDGVPRSLEPQVFDLLLYFVENPDRVVSQDELIAAIWNGRIVSDAAISSRISAARRAIGDSGAKQSLIKTVPRRGFRFLGSVETAGESAAAEPAKEPPQGRQTVRFCTSGDGTRIAYAQTGVGYPLVRAGHWLTHLEHDWNSPIWRPFLDRLGATFQVTRYDQRGNGLSDWDVGNFNLENFVDDLEAVVDKAGLDTFALYGTSQGAPISIAYATRHPDRVSHLILHGGYVRGRMQRGSSEEREQGEALLTLMRHGWGKQGSPFLKAFTSMYIPDATPEQTASLVDLQRLTTSPENAVKIRSAVDNFDVSDVIGAIATPTLVMHARNDGVQPLDQGRKLAAGIPGAEFVLLESANHALVPQEPAWDTLFEEITRFVA